MKARGLAQVIVVLKTPPASAARKAMAGLADCFEAGETSLATAIAAAVGQKKAPAHQFYPNLGILLGTAKKGGRRPGAVNVFRNLGSFVVAARPEFVKALTAEPEIESAIANRPPVPLPRFRAR